MRMSDWDKTKEQLLRELEQAPKNIEKPRDASSPIAEIDQAALFTEKLPRLLIDNSPLAIILCDVTGAIRDVNAAFAQLMESSSVEEVSRINVLTFPPLMNAGVSDDIRKCLESEGSIVSERQITNVSGRQVHVRVRAVGIGEGGGVAGALVILEDITERRRFEESLVDAERFKSLKVMAGSLAHSFNEVLQIVLAGAQAALEDIESGDLAKAKSNLLQVLDSTRSNSEPVMRLQRFAGLRSDISSIEGDVFDLSYVASLAARMTRPWWDTAANGKEIGLTQDLADGCLVRGKLDELFEVVVSLINNAAEAMPEGGDVHVATWTKGDAVHLSVRDNGSGIPEEHLNDVFKPFWTSKGTRATGLGLARSLETVRRHKGDISVESIKGKGAQFTVTLPRAEKMAREAVPVIRRAEMPRLKLLVIDDTEGVVRMVRDGLTKLGQDVFTALSGEEGVEIFRNTPIDLVICDLVMPGMSGWAVGKAVREICSERSRRKTPFILLTGWGGQLGEYEKVAESGVDVIVEKPVDNRMLMEVAWDLVRQSEEASFR